MLDQALENICLIEYTETDGLGIIHILLEMLRLSREMEFMHENQAMDVSFLKRKSGKNITPKGIDFVKTFHTLSLTMHTSELTMY